MNLQVLSREGIVRYTRILLAVMFLFLGGCDQFLENKPSPSFVGSTQTQTANWYSLYFVDPTRPDAMTFRGGSDQKLAEAIAQARLNIDVAAYDLNLWSIRDALIAANRRGVVVRVVTESDNLDEAEIQDLKDAGIPVLGDRREGLMHNKFVVIDRQEVWTGSMNFTTTDAYLNDNNLIRLRSVRLAENYAVEFEEMFKDDLFGYPGRADTPYPKLMVDGTPVEVYFSPEDGVAAHFLEKIQDAKTSIYFMAYSFTSDDLATALLNQMRAGVTVMGVMEEAQVASNIGGEYERLKAAGMDVRLDGNPHNMHHKVIILDEQIVITGSYNFSANAEKRNDENVLIIDNAEIADWYLEEFKRVYEKAR